MAVRDGLDVGLNYWPTNLVVSWSWHLFSLGGEYSFSFRATVEGSTAVMRLCSFRCEVLSGSCWIGQFAEWVQLSLSFKDESHFD